jgi:hypothetical protein
VQHGYRILYHFRADWFMNQSDSSILQTM